jgi:hypothetical protein
MTTAEKILRAKQDYDDVYQAGQSSMIDESKIIPKTIAPTNPVIVQDVSEIPHDLTVQLTSGTITDFSGVEVVQTGKNIYGYIKPRVTNGTIVEKLENGVIAQGNQSETDAESLSSRGALGSGYDSTSAICPKVFEGQTITLSADVTLLEIGNSPKPNQLVTYIYIQGGNNAFNKNFTLDLNVKHRIVHTFTIKEQHSGKVIYPVFRLNSNKLRIENIQFEFGTVATEYESYKEHRAAANSSGVVEGLKSVSPKMTIYSNADVDIELTYNKSWGMDYENKAWWDRITNHNTRTIYDYGFAKWNCEYLRPPYKIVPIHKDSANMSRQIMMFSDNPSLLAIEKDYFDLSRVLTSDTNQTSGLYYTFRECPKLRIIEDINIQPGWMYYTFRNDSSLETIERLPINKTTKVQAPFSGCSSLKNIVIDGQIGVSISFSVCPLSKASIKSIVNALCTDTDITGQTLTLKKSAVNEAFGINVDDETTYPVGSEYYELRYSKPNWTIAYA